MKTVRQFLYSLAWKPSTIKRLIKSGMISQGEILQTRITPEGLEQDILIVPVQTVESINLKITI